MDINHKHYNEKLNRSNASRMGFDRLEDYHKFMDKMSRAGGKRDDGIGVYHGKKVVKNAA